MSTATRCTLKQLSEIVGVAPSTVSRVLNHSYSKVKVSDETARRIHSAVKEYGYAPNINARRLLQNRSYVIGLEVPAWQMGTHAFADHILVETLRGIEDTIVNSAYKLLILFKTEKYLQTQENIKLLKEKAIDGLLIWGASYLDTYAAELRDYPVIFLNSRPKELKDVNFVGHDNFNACREITEYAIHRAGRQFLYFSGLNTNSVNEERRNGFLAALAHHGLVLPRENFIQAEYRRDLAEQCMDRILTEKKLVFDTVVCANDNMAAGVYDAVLKHGLRLPDAFRLAGGDGGHEAFDDFRITTFKVDSFKLGALATRIMIDLSEGKERNLQDIQIKSQLLIRQTL